ncbi:alpha-L-fucosidase [Paenibacillus sp. Marseille-Q9583]
MKKAPQKVVGKNTRRQITNKIALVVAFTMLFSTFFQSYPAAVYAAEPDDYEPTWESVGEHDPAPEWFQDAKFGIYAHWGAYSVPAYSSEWYPKYMFEDGSKERSHHENVYGNPQVWPYHNFIEGASDKEGNRKQFMPVLKSEGGQFDPEEWAELFKNAGARFAGPVAEHHDGYSMWDSEVNEWNTVDKGPGIDIVRLLTDAIRGQGMKTIVSNHHAYNYNGFYKAVPPQEDPSLQKLYGQLPKEELDQLWYDKLNELVVNYDPDIIWHDFDVNKVGESQRLKFLSEYYNRAKQQNKEVVVTYKRHDLDAFRDGEVIDYERGGPADITDNYWLTDDSVSSSSWSYTDGMSYYSLRALIHSLIDRVSKNGNLLLNISPMADGSIPQEQKDILMGMGRWLEKYGEAIYSTRAWSTFGEGPTPMNGEIYAEPHEGNEKDIRFTRNKAEDTLYAIGLGWPQDNKMKISKLSKYTFDTAQLKKVSLVDGEELTWKQDTTGLMIDLPATIPAESAQAYAVKLEFEQQIPEYKDPNRNIFYQTDATDFSFATGKVEEQMDNESWQKNLGNIYGGDHVVYNRRDFGAGAKSLTVMASAMSEMTIDFRIGSPDGPKVATAQVPNTGDWKNYVKVEAKVDSSITGIHDLYVVFSEGAGLRWFQFQPSTEYETRNAFDWNMAASFNDATGNIRVENSSEGIQNLAFTSNGDYTIYKNMDFKDGARKLSIRAATTTPMKINVYIDDPSGRKIASVKVPNTGDWQQYKTIDVELDSIVTGIHDVYLEFSDSVNVGGFKFEAKFDDSLLVELIERALALNAVRYTMESWIGLQQALAKAQTIQANVNATQDEIDAAIIGLKAAIAGLVRVETGGPNEEFRGVHSDTPASHWKDGMVSGNGLLGVVSYGDPLDERFIYQNTKFNLPNDGVREAPDISSVLNEVQRLTLEGRGKEAASKASEAASGWLRETSGNPNANWEIVHTYSFHPGYEAKLNVESEGQRNNYDRWTNYETGEIGARWSDSQGDWARKTFVSRPDNVIVTYMENPTEATSFGASVNINVEDLPNFQNTGIITQQEVEATGDYLVLKAKYPLMPNSPLATGGYAGVTKIVTDGAKRVSGNDVRVEGATYIALVTTLDRQEKDFELDQAELVDSLLEQANTFVGKYTNADTFNYESALAPHATVQGEMMNRVKLNLNGDSADRQLTSDKLLQKQYGSPDTINLALAEKVFDSGRYAYISASGHNPPRLMGLWTGEFQPQWSGDFTTDANINLQIAGGNIGNTPEAMESYFNLIMRDIEDWEVNAERIFGIKDAILAPPRTDGDGAPLTHFTDNDSFPGQYWISGASWLLFPFYEYYLTSGNQEIPDGKGGKRPVLDILFEKLTMVGNFFDGLLTEEFVDENGNFIMVPTYSPENVPANRNSTIQPNATMDIASTKDALLMLIEVSELLGNTDDIAKWEQLLSRLPEYKYNSNGSLKEWAMDDLEDQNYHRHISHLYPAWPALESKQNPDNKLNQGIIKVLDSREQIGGESAAHGLVHKGLVEARVNRAEGVYESLLPLFTDRYLFTSLLMSHNDWWKAVYCTDGPITIPAIIMESLAYTDADTIELLPALPEQWATGDISGMRARNQTEIKTLEWDLNNGIIKVVLNSDKTQTLMLSTRYGIDEIVVYGAEVKEALDMNAREISLTAGVDAEITITLPTLVAGAQVFTNEATGMMLSSEATAAVDTDAILSAGGIDPIQTWELVQNSGNNYFILNGKSGKALDVADESSSDSADIIQWSLTKKNNQQWKVEEQANGYYVLINQLSGKALTSMDEEANTAIRQRSVNRQDAQLWQMLPVEDGTVQFINKKSGLYLKPMSNSTSDGAKIVQNDASKGVSKRELWNIKPAGSNSYQIANELMGQVLEARGEVVKLGAWNNDAEQKWTLEQLDDNSYKIINASSGLVLQASKLAIGQELPLVLGEWKAANPVSLQKWFMSTQQIKPELQDGPQLLWGGNVDWKVQDDNELTLEVVNLEQAISKAELTISFDPALLEVTGITSASNEAVDWKTVKEGEIRVVLEGELPASTEASKLLVVKAKSKETERSSANIYVEKVVFTTANDEQLLAYGNQVSLTLYADAASIVVVAEDGKTTIDRTNGTLQLSAIVKPLNVRNKAVVWSVENVESSDKTIATISKDGLLNALNNGRIKVIAKALDHPEITGELIITISNEVEKLTGTVFGYGAPYSGCNSCTYDKMFDGDINTYFDANEANGQYAGIDLGEGNEAPVKLIRFYPREDNAYRMKGGKFQGSNTSSTEGFEDIYVIPSTPPYGWNEVELVTPSQPYRYLRYLSPNSGYGNVNEIEFYAVPVIVIENEELKHLNEIIDQSKARLLQTIEGSKPGEFTPEARAELQAAIEAAELVAGQEGADKETIIDMIAVLQQALTDYNASEIVGQPEKEASLVNIAVLDENGQEVALSPSFNPLTKQYEAVVEDDAGHVTVSAATYDSKAVVQLKLADHIIGESGNTVTEKIELTGAETMVTLEVTAQDTAITERYTLSVKRKEKEIPVVITVSAISSLPDIGVAYGTMQTDLPLPQQVEVTLSDNSKHIVNISAWDNGTPSYNATTAGTYLFKGELALSEQWSNAKQLLAEVKVIVARQSDGGNSGITDPVATPKPTPTPTPTPEKEETKDPTDPKKPTDPKQPTISFKDIVGHWAENAIMQATAKGIIKGYTDETFRPNMLINREQFVVMLVRVLQPEQQAAGTAKFTDSKEISSWASDAIAYAKQIGIVNGYADGSFRPQDEISRAEMVTLIVRVLNLSDQAEGVVTKFADDQEIPGWAKPFVVLAVQHGIVKGKSNNLFEPNATATRAEAIMMLMRMLSSNSQQQS